MSARSKALYDALGVDASAPPQDIKRAYRRKAKISHPDAGGNADAFHALQHAYAVLANPDRRARYDQTGDDSGVDNIQTQALGIIQNALDQVIDAILAAGDNPARTDVIAVLRDQFEQNIARINDEIRGIEKKYRVLADAAKRFRAKRGDNVLRRSTEHKAEAMRAKSVSARDALGVLKHSLGLLDNYEFEFEIPPPRTAPAATFGASPTFTWGSR